MSFGSSGTGTSPYLAMELFKSLTAVNIVHVPYKGTGAAVIDLMGGHVQTMFGSVSGTLPFVRSGKLRAGHQQPAALAGAAGDTDGGRIGCAWI